MQACHSVDEHTIGALHVALQCRLQGHGAPDGGVRGDESSQMTSDGASRHATKEMVQGHFEKRSGPTKTLREGVREGA